MLAMLSLSLMSSAQNLSDEQARGRAEAAVRHDLGLDEAQFLNPHRLETLEEAVLPFTPLKDGRREKPLYFFEISQEGTENRAGNIVEHTSSDGHPVQYVAVDRSSGETYRLYGLKTPEQEFNRMASDFHFHVNDEADARLLALLYTQSVLGPASKTVIYSLLDVKHAIEDYFYGHSHDQQQASRKSEQWWSGFIKLHGAEEFGIRANKVAQGYKVSFAKTSLRESAIPRVEKYAFEISPNGHVSAIQTKTLYPN
jgi:hypothetical protein